MSDTPVLPCHDHHLIASLPSSSGHRLQSPTYTIPPSILPHIQTAASDLRAGRTVAFPTETVYGLGAHSLDPEAVKRIYEIKNRPSDNPLIIHVSSLDMLDRLLPPSYALSPLYQALIDAFWPGPLTLLFPSPNPPPPPAPSTIAIRMPNHPLALALISHADLPVSAPSANSSGRPSPTTAQHVWNDLNHKPGLGCILDGGACGVGVESTVVNGLGWQADGVGSVDILRPGGLGVEAIARVVEQVEVGKGRTEVLLHGRPWRASFSNGTHTPPTTAPRAQLKEGQGEAGPSTPGMKYRHYSPRVPVYLVLPSSTFPRPPISAPSTDGETSAQGLLRSIRQSLRAGNQPRRVGLLYYDNSPLFRSLTAIATSESSVELVPLSLGEDATSAAQRLFAGLLTLEGRPPGEHADEPGGRVDRPNGANSNGEHADKGVEVILVEGCSDGGLGLAVMERIRKAVGGGGRAGGLENGEVGEGLGNGTFWIDV